MYRGKLTRATQGSAGYDMHACEDCVIEPSCRRLVSTGVYFESLDGRFGLIKSRSGLSVRGIDVGAGVIDSDYRGEIKVLICNNGVEPFAIQKDMRIAQIIILEYALLEKSENNNILINNHAGFGSTGI